jgi:diguanylate cyclase (GGDEF)-like protein
VTGTTTPTDEATFAVDEARAVEIECIRQVVLQPSSDVGLVFAGACSLVAALVGHISVAPAGIWLVAVLVMRMIVRHESSAFGKRLTDPEPRSPLRHLVSEACEGIVWGSSIFILHPREQHYEIFVVLALCAVSIIAALSMSPYFLAAMAFTVPINAIEVAYFVHDGGRWGWEAAGAVFTIFTITLRYAGIVNETLRKAVADRRELARLASQLDAAKGRVEETNAALVSRNDQLRTIANHDALTGLFNRRHFMEELDRASSDMSDSPWFLAILDADHFKRINDVFGHPRGDEVLVAIGAAALSQLRHQDCFARIGGEEFGLLIRQVSFEDAVAVVERIRSAVGAIDLGVGALTMSAGLVVGEPGATPASTLGRADTALYMAKHAGRNQLVCC